MRWATLGATALIALCAVSAEAQVGQGGPYRHFTRSPVDTNGNETIIYAPVGWGFFQARPTRQPYNLSAASWFRASVGAENVKPDQVLDDARYILESFDTVTLPNTPGPLFRVVVRRNPAPPDPDLPVLRVVDPQTQISSGAPPSVEEIAEGVRYTFLVRPPHYGLLPVATPSGRPIGQYEVQFLPPRAVKPPPALVRAPTFGGADRESRDSQPPPQLPAAERVAGKRIEYRSGRVVEEGQKDRKR